MTTDRILIAQVSHAVTALVYHDAEDSLAAPILSSPTSLFHVEFRVNQFLDDVG